ncbi:exostosin domain-containing protein [Flavobacterium adhaerens]|uniref:exostosin domain-containing protein n=1 Tax=Flavobacterium adhaerens TaxID=3149043 RepID=UPI0032B3B342
MKIHIPHTDIVVNNKKKLFVLTRPFFIDGKWSETICSISEAEVVLLPFSINYYFDNKKEKLLKIINAQCLQYRIKVYGYIAGDFGQAYPEFSNIIYFRMGGFKKQLSDKNKGFPVSLSDHFQRLYQIENPIPKEKSQLPIVGFCGHATLGQAKRAKETVKFVIENAKRFFKNPFRNDWEPLFASAYERAKLLSSLEKSSLIATNFIYRKNYRAGAQTEVEREKTTLEYYDNIANSDYVVCVRGAGNFSVRLYETLMMGKIPVFVDTDCLLPFEDEIDWKKHLVWIEWKNRKQIAQKIIDFHNSISNQEFIDLQISNRKLWKETLSVNGMLSMIKCKL